jgi:short subunit dehydrogenase-like uncharacterized protein
MPSDFLLYGANGFVGREAARLAVQRGLKPILAGRNAAQVQALATELHLPCRVFGLDDPTAMDKALKEVTVVLHCAGPFIYTAKPMVDGCLRTGVHYLDISGAIFDLEAVVRRDEEAKARRVMLLPGAGFDVVPTDCLALHLKHRLPAATHLALAFYSQGSTKLPPGTLNTLLDSIPRQKPGVIVRRNGALESVPAGKWRMIDFGDGPVRALGLTWGDVFTAFYTTGIPNIEEYMVQSEQQSRGLRALRRLGPLVRLAVVRNFLRSKIPSGPTPEERDKTRTHVWGEVEDDQGHKAVSRLHGPEAGVIWTALAALSVVRRVLAGEAPPGFQTPALAYGADFVMECEGVTREDAN